MLQIECRCCASPVSANPEDFIVEELQRGYQLERNGPAPLLL